MPFIYVATICGRYLNAVQLCVAFYREVVRRLYQLKYYTHVSLALRPMHVHPSVSAHQYNFSNDLRTILWLHSMANIIKSCGTLIHLLYCSDKTSVWVTASIELISLIRNLNRVYMYLNINDKRFVWTQVATNSSRIFVYNQRRIEGRMMEVHKCMLQLFYAG